MVRTPFLSIDIGCGAAKHPNATFGIDKVPLPGVDFVVDLEHEPLPFAESTVDAIFTRHALEHVRNLEHVLREIYRVSKPSATVHITVPDFTNALGYSDYTHCRFFGYYSFDYFSPRKDPRWKVPTYVEDVSFEIRRKRLRFQNMSVLRPVVEAIVNSGHLMPYVYESKLAWLVPCFEIDFELSVRKSSMQSTTNR